MRWLIIARCATILGKFVNLPLPVVALTAPQPGTGATTLLRNLPAVLIRGRRTDAAPDVPECGRQLR